jgi:hypothetical protein
MEFMEQKYNEKVVSVCPSAYFISRSTLWLVKKLGTGESARK